MTMFFPLSVIGGHSLGIHNTSKQGKYNKKMPLNKAGHYTTVDGVPVRKLFIGNLTASTLEKHLLLAFKCFGKVVDVSIIKPPNERKSNKSNFGFVTFETPAEASRALKRRHSMFILNRKVYIFPADSWHQPLELPNGEILWDRRKGKDGVKNTSFSDESVSHVLDDVIPEAVNLAERDESDVDCQMSKLNDDCLLLIFDCLPMNERLVINKVCRRWKLLNMRMWHGLRKLDFTVSPLSGSTLTDKLLERYLNLCPNISYLNIAQDDHKLTAGAIVTISNCCKKLESITIRDIQIQKRSLAFLARSCPLLKSFHMDACTTQHDNEMVALVKNSYSLEDISLKYSSSSVGIWLKFLHPPVKSVSLEMYDFDSDYLMQGIKNVTTTLKELKFISCGSSIRSKDVEFIASIVPELSSLTLSGGFSDFKSHSLTPITKLKKLTRLDLDNNTFVCDHFLNELSQQCSLLKYFSLSGIDDRYLTVQGLSVLSQFTGLTHLTLACLTKLNDVILKSISHKLKNLQHLDLMGCTSITDEGCQCIVTNCKELEVLDVSGCLTVTNLTVTTAIENSSKRTGKKKLKIIAGESGIDLDVCWSSEVIVDPSSSIMSQYPGAMFIIDPQFRYDDDELFNNLYLDEFDEYDDIYDDNDDDDDSLFDEPCEFIPFSCNTDSDDLSNPGEYDLYY